MKRYSQFIILSMGVFAMKIEIISVSTILHATSFRDYFDTTVYTLMLLFFCSFLLSSTFVLSANISRPLRMESVKLQSFQFKKLRLGGELR